jgi:hypothetical protein
MPVTFPPLYDTAPCYLVAINREMIPFVGGLLKIAEKRGFWNTDDDYRRGYNAIVGIERCLMATCLTDLLEREDRLYRMLDTALYGTAYTIVTTDPLVVTPDIPAARGLDFDDQNSVLGRLDRLAQTQEAFVAGTDTPLYSGTPNVHALLQAIIDALASENTDIGSLLTKLEVIAGLLA